MTALPLFLLIMSLLLAIPGGLLLRRNGSLSLIAAIALLIMATASAYTGWRLYQNPPSSPPNIIAPQPGSGRFHVTPPEDLAATLMAARGYPVLLEFHADWCPSCLRWQNEVFSRTDVQEALRPFILLKIDATQLTPEIQALLDQYRLPGLPAMLLFNRTGQELTDLRLLGEMSPDEFKSWLTTRLMPQLQ